LPMRLWGGSRPSFANSHRRAQATAPRRVRYVGDALRRPLCHFSWAHEWVAATGRREWQGFPARTAFERAVPRNPGAVCGATAAVAQQRRSRSIPRPQSRKARSAPLYDRRTRLRRQRAAESARIAHLRACGIPRPHDTPVDASNGACGWRLAWRPVRGGAAPAAPVRGM